MVARPLAASAAVPAPDQDSDELIELIRRGSHDALAQMYDRHAGEAYAIALRLLGDRSDAEEVVQETFLALWNRAEQFDPARGSARAWLLSIARNRAIDRARAGLARIQTSTFSSVMAGVDEDGETDDWLIAAAEPIAVGASAVLPEQALVDGETSAALQAALERLDPPERNVLVLAYREQLSQSEIATRLRWPLGTVKTRTRRALRNLRTALEEAVAAGVEAEISSERPRGCCAPCC